MKALNMKIIALLAVTVFGQATLASTPVKSVICGDKSFLAIEIIAGGRGERSSVNLYAMGNLRETLPAIYMLQVDQESTFISAPDRSGNKYLYQVVETGNGKASLSVYEFPSEIKVDALDTDDCIVKK